MMYSVLIFYFLYFAYARAGEASTACYLDHCQNLTASTSVFTDRCSLSKVESGTDCGELKFEESEYILPIDSTAKFYLLAYVRDSGGSLGKVTAFNLTVIDANFHRLTTNYRNLLDGNQPACNRIELYGNKTYPNPTELYLSCPFSYDTYGSSDSKLQILVTGDAFQYSRQYVFKVPDHRFLDENVTVNEFVPFTYIDTSVPSVLTLNVQRHPERFNISQYKIWLINNDTNSEITVYVDVLTSTHEKFVTYNFNGGTGSYYFKASAVHPECGKLGCPTSTTPTVTINGRSYRLLIMIVSTIWIPPAIAYALYRIYKCYKRKAKRSRVQPNCLLVYAPTRPTHVNVVTEVAKLLRGANINAMVDTLDITDATEKDLRLWANDAFSKADVILIITSPPLKELAEDSESCFEILRVFKENSSNKCKRFFTLLLPYCKVEDVPEEARKFKVFHVPQALFPLVKVIHGGTSRKICLPCDKDLVDSIKVAETEIAKASSILENLRETDGLLQSDTERRTAVNKDQD